MIPELETAQKFLQSARAPLLWRVIPWTFFSVGIAQLLSLYPLMQWHQRQLYEHRVEVVQARVDSALGGAASLNQALDLALTHDVVALALYTPKGELLQQRGASVVTTPSAVSTTPSFVKHDAHTLQVSWVTTGSAAVQVSALLNIDAEAQQQKAFVLRAALLSVPSAVIATLIGCFILLRGVILPVRRLRDELLARDAVHLPEKSDAPESIDELDDVRSFVDRLEAARASAQAMQALATTDELTSVYTRRYFKEALERHLELAQRDGTELSVVTIDVDFFKSINDTYGHSVGDDVLKWVASTCRDSLRAGDVLARYGGEEFMVLLPNTGVEGAGAVSEKVRQAIEQKVRTPRPVTASLGTATWSRHADPTGAQMLRHADEALYVAKHTGRNRVVQHERTSRRMAS